MKLNKRVYDFIFWTISLIVVFQILTHDYDVSFSNYLFIFIFHIPLIFVFYLGRLLSRLWLAGGKKIYFIISILLTLILGYIIHHFVFDYLSDIIFPSYYLFSYFTLIEIFQFNSLYLFLGCLFFFTINWFELKNKQAQLEKDNHQAQIKNLKNQINPHFLFNSLNNIYSQINSDNKVAKTYLLNLSESLRYMIYDTEETLVTLSKEMDYLNNYLKLEKLRFDKKENIVFNAAGNFENYLIAPLLLIPIIENAFKYTDRTDPEITIGLQINNDELELICKNNRAGEMKEIKDSGFGLKNLKNRLELLYPDKHTLDLQDDENYFTATLNLNLSL